MKVKGLMNWGCRSLLGVEGIDAVVALEMADADKKSRLPASTPPSGVILALVKRPQLGRRLRNQFASAVDVKPEASLACSTPQNHHSNQHF